MEKKHWIVVGLALLSLIAVIGVSVAQSGNSKKNMDGMMGNGMMGSMGMANSKMHGAMHGEMGKIMEGSYADFVKFREESGFNMMPWIQSEEDFRQMQQMHLKMQKYMDENGETGCPMMG